MLHLIRAFSIPIENKTKGNDHVRHRAIKNCLEKSMNVVNAGESMNLTT